MTDAITKRRKLIIESVVLMLVLTAVVTPAGRRGAADVGTELVKISNVIANLPCRIVTGFNTLSLERLDPTCPQCI